MKHGSKLASGLLVVMLAIAAAGAGYLTNRSLQPRVPDTVAAAPGAAETLYALTLPDLAGVEQSLEQWRGKVIVANFWATWCPPCVKEIPEFSAVSRRHADAPLQFVGISIDTRDNVASFAKRFDVPYPLLIGSTATLGLASELGNSARALPFTVILGRDGTIRHVTLGTLSESQLEGKILPLLDL